MSEKSLVSGAIKLSGLGNDPLKGDNAPLKRKQSVGSGVTPQGRTFKRVSDATEEMGKADSRKVR